MADSGRLDEKLGRRTAADFVAERLRLEINSGSIAPGTKLRQADIAERLGVSTTPVREAFALLASAGLVQVDRHKGTVVFQPTIEDLVELFRIRQPLEDLALVAAGPNLSSVTVEELDELLSTMTVAKEPAERYRPHFDFHYKLFALSRMPRLTTMIADLREASTRYAYAIVAAGRSYEAEDREHRAMVEACKHRDIHTLRDLNRQHLRVTVNAAVEYMRSNAGPAGAEPEPAGTSDAVAEP